MRARGPTTLVRAAVSGVDVSTTAPCSQIARNRRIGCSTVRSGTIQSTTYLPNAVATRGGAERRRRVIERTLCAPSDRIDRRVAEEVRDVLPRVQAGAIEQE